MHDEHGHTPAVECEHTHSHTHTHTHEHTHDGTPHTHRSEERRVGKECYS